MGGGAERAHLPPNVMNPLQIALIERSGLDPAEWVRQHAAFVRELVEMSAPLRRVAVDDPARAVELILKVLAERPDTDATEKPS